MSHDDAPAAAPADDDGRPVTPAEWRTIKAVVTAALARPREERADFVADACGDDPRVRREVLALLDSPDTDPGLDDAPPLAGGLGAAALEALAGAIAAGGPIDGARAATLTTRDAAAIGEAMPPALRDALADRYRVEGRIGRGGMATVYRAHDLRHGRPVAIKVLHPRLAGLLGRERFLREIALTASLQHPAILPLFDSGSEAGQLYYVMPYVEGETLRARLARQGRLPVGEALEIARAIAGALAHAHARGIVHRDVKPENVLLARGDHPGAPSRVLVADFGIARAVGGDAAGPLLTRTGVAIGTPRYMAPEQARGDREVDARVDVYALGAVLHEMLAGAAPARREPSAGDGVRGDAPAAGALARPDVPPHVAAAVATALADAPEARHPDIVTFAAALVPLPSLGDGGLPAQPDDLATREVAAVGAPGARAHGASRAGLPRAGAVTALVGAMLAVGAFAGWQAARLWARAEATPLLPVGKSTTVATTPATEPARAMSFAADEALLDAGFPVLSPDGRTIVVRAVSGGDARLYARPIGSDASDGEPLLPRALDGTTGAAWPTFSPDGAWLAFVADGAVRRVPAGGGAAETLAALPEAVEVGGLAWLVDGTIAVADRAGGAVYAVRDGRVGRAAVRGSTPRVRDLAPFADRRGVFATVGDADAPRLVAIDLGSGERRELAPGRTPRLAEGRLLFVTAGGVLVRQPFDDATMTLRGTPEQVGVDVATRDDQPAFSASARGAVLFRADGARDAAAPDRDALRLTLRDRTGRVLREFAAARAPWTPRVSPDGRTVVHGAAADGAPASEVWTTDLRTGATRRRTTGGVDANDPQWSPDGRALAWSDGRPGNKRVLVRALDGGAARTLAAPGGSIFPSGWTADGRAVLATVERDGNTDIVALPVDGGPARDVVRTPARESAARLSPDGRFIAYQSDEGGVTEVYVDTYPAGGRRVRVSTGGGVHPAWRGDGRELFFWAGRRLLAVDVTLPASVGAVRVGTPTELFAARYPDALFAMYDVSPDGQQVVLSAGPAPRGRLVLLPPGATAR